MPDESKKVAQAQEFFVDSLAVGAIDYMSIVRFSEVLEVEFLDTIVIEIDVIAFSDIEDALNL